MKLGLLPPAYGLEVIGGAEQWARLLAEHLVADRGWSVEVFTTCASSAELWAGSYRPGTCEVNGVTVHRFESRSGRNPEYLHQLPRLRTDAGSFDDAEAGQYLSLVGPVCPDVLDAAEASGCDLFSAIPYLYWPAVEAVRRLGRRVLFDPCTHDEPELYLGPVGAAFTSAGGIAYRTYAERALVERTYRVAHLPSAVVGSAITAGAGDPQEARAALGLGPEQPFALCLGKVEPAKGSHALADLWSLYRQRRGSDAPVLVFLGPVHGEAPAPEGVVYAGRQPEPVKWGALDACSVLISPSLQESFGLVLLEAWVCGRPVLVNARCPATVEHCRRSGGGLWFEGFADFEVALDRLFGSPELADRLGARGRDYASTAFSWEAVLDRYEALAGRVASAARRGSGRTL